MELKIMQTAVVGKVTDRKSTQVNGTQYYHVEIMTESQYPDVFDFWTSDPTVSAANVPELAVGKRVLAVGWIRGRKITTFTDKVTGEQKPLKFPRYKMSLRLGELSAAPESEQPQQSQVNDESDIPF